MVKRHDQPLNENAMQLIERLDLINSPTTAFMQYTG